MPDPHTETGSQDVVVINATESLVGLHDVTALRFILRQPSPNWKTFNVDEIAVSTVLEFISHKVRSKRSENKSFFFLAAILDFMKSFISQTLIQTKII